MVDILKKTRVTSCFYLFLTKYNLSNRDTSQSLELVCEQFSKSIHTTPFPWGWYEYFLEPHNNKFVLIYD